MVTPRGSECAFGRKEAVYCLDSQLQEILNASGSQMDLNAVFCLVPTSYNVRTEAIAGRGPLREVMRAVGDLVLRQVFS